jgi:hypothetical protein
MITNLGRDEVDITGKRFGKLVALGKAAAGVWRFACDCGAAVQISKVAVVTNGQKSCGCLRLYLNKARGHQRTMDMTGRTFGRLKVLRLAPLDEKNVGDRGARWVCQCDCGEQCTVRGTLLRYGQTKSCGCLRVKGRSEPRPISPGEKFGLLTALYEIGASGQGSSWICGCECGEAHIARAKDLRIGTTRSCGCARVAAQKRNAQAVRGTRVAY